MILAIDIDGVLRNFTESLVEQYKKDYPEHKVLPITQWYFDNSFPIGKEIHKYWRETRAKEIFTQARPYDGAREFLERLRAAGHYILLLTTQPYGAEAYTFEWLYKNKMLYDSIAFSAKKGLYVYEVLLDDGVHNLEAAKLSGNYAVCFDRAWNRAWGGNRVYSFEQFEKAIGEYEEKRKEV